jgi:hypothetical protein
MDKFRRYLLLVFLLLYGAIADAMTYYISNSGNDSSDGLSENSAWKTIARLNQVRLQPGDFVLFKSGDTFYGNLWIQQHSSGTRENPVKITTTGKEKAFLKAGNDFGIFAENVSGIIIDNLNISGSGVTENTNQGVIFFNTLGKNNHLPFIRISNSEVSGFRKAGIFIGGKEADSGFEDVIIHNCLTFSNGEAGIFTYAPERFAVKNISVINCKAFDNEGRKEISDTHTGNGILLGYVQYALIEHCEAFRNGGLNGHAGGGPVGIWCYESDKVLIQYNRSHHNQAGADADGGGFDIDGGTTNSILQYNYSHDNEGAGYLIAQFKGASPLLNNIIRHNVSHNDGRNNSYGGITLWGADPFSDCLIHDNKVIVDDQNITSGTPAALRLINVNFSGIKIYNNSFQATGNAMLLNSSENPGTETISLLNNTYHFNPLSRSIWWKFNFSDVHEWIKFSGQESGNTQITAMPVKNDYRK